jgi:hypothetical protein
LQGEAEFSSVAATRICHIIGKKDSKQKNYWEIKNKDDEKGGGHGRGEEKPKGHRNHN